MIFTIGIAYLFFDNLNAILEETDVSDRDDTTKLFFSSVGTHTALQNQHNCRSINNTISSFVSQPYQNGNTEKKLFPCTISADEFKKQNNNGDYLSQTVGDCDNKSSNFFPNFNDENNGKFEEEKDCINAFSTIEKDTAKCISSSIYLNSFTEFNDSESCSYIKSLHSGNANIPKTLLKKPNQNEKLLISNYQENNESNFISKPIKKQATADRGGYNTNTKYFKNFQETSQMQFLELNNNSDSEYCYTRGNSIHNKNFQKISQTGSKLCQYAPLGQYTNHFSNEQVSSDKSTCKLEAKSHGAFDNGNKISCLKHDVILNKSNLHDMNYLFKPPSMQTTDQTNRENCYYNNDINYMQKTDQVNVQNQNNIYKSSCMQTTDQTNGENCYYNNDINYMQKTDQVNVQNQNNFYKSSFMQTTDQTNGENCYYNNSINYMQKTDQVNVQNQNNFYKSSCMQTTDQTNGENCYYNNGINYMQKTDKVNVQNQNNFYKSSCMQTTDQNIEKNQYYNNSINYMQITDQANIQNQNSLNEFTWTQMTDQQCAQYQKNFNKASYMHLNDQPSGKNQCYNDITNYMQRTDQANIKNQNSLNEFTWTQTTDQQCAQHQKNFNKASYMHLNDQPSGKNQCYNDSTNYMQRTDQANIQNQNSFNQLPHIKTSNQEFNRYQKNFNKYSYMQKIIQKSSRNQNGMNVTYHYPKNPITSTNLSITIRSPSLKGSNLKRLRNESNVKNSMFCDKDISYKKHIFEGQFKNNFKKHTYSLDQVSIQPVFQKFDRNAFLINDRIKNPTIIHTNEAYQNNHCVDTGLKKELSGQATIVLNNTNINQNKNVELNLGERNHNISFASVSNPENNFAKNKPTLLDNLVHKSEDGVCLDDGTMNWSSKFNRKKSSKNMGTNLTVKCENQSKKTQSDIDPKYSFKKSTESRNEDLTTSIQNNQSINRRILAKKNKKMCSKNIMKKKIQRKTIKKLSEKNELDQSRNDEINAKVSTEASNLKVTEKQNFDMKFNIKILNEYINLIKKLHPNLEILENQLIENEIMFKDSESKEIKNSNDANNNILKNKVEEFKFENNISQFPELLIFRTDDFSEKITGFKDNFSKAYICKIIDVMKKFLSLEIFDHIKLKDAFKAIKCEEISCDHVEDWRTSFENLSDQKFLRSSKKKNGTFFEKELVISKCSEHLNKRKISNNNENVQIGIDDDKNCNKKIENNEKLIKETENKISCKIIEKIISYTESKRLFRKIFLLLLIIVEDNNDKLLIYENLFENEFNKTVKITDYNAMIKALTYYNWIFLIILKLNKEQTLIFFPCKKEEKIISDYDKIIGKATSFDKKFINRYKRNIISIFFLTRTLPEFFEKNEYFKEDTDFLRELEKFKISINQKILDNLDSNFFKLKSWKCIDFRNFSIKIDEIYEKLCLN